MYLEELKVANLNLVHDHSTKLNEILELVRMIPSQASKVLKEDDDSVLFQAMSKALETIAASSARQWLPEHEIVHSLYFDSLIVRHESIQGAHRKTFEWLLRSRGKRPGRDRSCPQATLLEWLQSGSGMYWVSGKPGSGKSTLMKFIADHQETQKALDRWAGPSECTTAAFYFWSAGARLQKSVEGLLRSLLFEVLVHVSELIPVVFPERWASMTATSMKRRRNFGVNSDKRRRDWTVQELSEALYRLSKTPDGSSKRFCFFIDGLDEYHGDHRELIRILSAISANHNIKLCVSSRPWNVFEDALGQDSSRKLYVHELTRNDIIEYTNSTFQQDANWVSGARINPRYGMLVDEITDKAQGVFLWVVLVVRSLREGLSNGDSLHMLELRIKNMPQELGPFFRHILSSISSIYHVQMALSFQVALNASRPLTLMHFSFLDDCFETEQFAFRAPIRPMDNHDIFSRHQTVRRRLNARCKGFLEAHLHPPETRPHLAHRVDFLHRTVRDFLRTDEMAQFLEDLLGDYPTNTVMANAYLAFIKSLPPDGSAAALVEEALHYSHKAEKESAEVAVQCVDELLHTVRAMKLDLASPTEFSRLVVRNGLCEYVSTAIQAGSDGFTDTSHLLDIALQNASSINPDDPDMNDMVSMLLNETTKLSNKQWRLYVIGLQSSVGRTTDPDMVKCHSRMLSLVLPHVENVNALNLASVTWGGLFANIVSNTDAPRAVGNIRQKMLAELLAYWADPNGAYRGQTIWAWLCGILRLCTENEASQRNAIRMEFLSNLTEMLLKAGADTSHASSLTVDEARSIFPARLANPICDLLRKQPVSPSPVTGWGAYFLSFVPGFSRFSSATPADSPAY